MAGMTAATTRKAAAMYRPVIPFGVGVHHEWPIAHRPHDAAGANQFPVDEPDSAAAGDAVHGMVQSGGPSTRQRSLARGVETLCRRPESARGEEDPLHQ